MPPKPNVGTALATKHHIDITPSWENVMPMYIEMLEGNNPFNKGEPSSKYQRDLAKKDLLRVATHLDRLKELKEQI